MAPSYIRGQCPGTTSLDCQCAFTTGYNCTAGHYCPSAVLPNASYPCPVGFLCPQNSAQPTFCCKGYYCPSSSEIHECPKGYYCKRGQSEPFSCGWLTSCPAGTSEGVRLGAYVLFFLSLVAVFGAYQFKEYCEKLGIRKRGQLLEQSTEQSSELKSDCAAKVSFALEDNKEDMTVDVDCENGKTHGTPAPAALTKMDIEFQDLGLTLRTGKTILENVSGVLRAGRVTAIMGPSGAGKTTFLSVLSGKVKKSKGVIKVNGKEEPNGITRFRSLVGYVPQEDVMLRSNTVYSILQFSANYRLPKDLTRVQKQEKIFNAIQLLGLSQVMESTIGDEKTRGISGGQRKRVNIGIELVTDPKVLFLDEPTSGLDSSSSLDVCMALRRLARMNNVLIAAVLHQPRYEIFASFDDLLILGKGGRTIYIGPSEDAIQFFEKYGFRCPPRVNVADFLMDIASGKVCRGGETALFDAALLPALWENRHSDEAVASILKQSANTIENSENSSDVVVKPSLPTSPSGGDIRKTWLARHCDALREFASDAKSDFIEYVSDLKDELKSTFLKDEFRQTPSVFAVLFLCLKRSFSGAYPGWGRFLRENLLHIMIGLFLGVVARPNDYLGPLSPSMAANLCPYMLQSLCSMPIADNFNRLAVFVCWGLSFAGAATAVGTFGFEEPNYFREVGSGMRTFPYYLSKAIAELPRIGFAALFFELAFLGIYETTVNVMVLYAIALLLYANGVAIGYVLTALIGVGLTPLFAVVLTLLFSTALSGTTTALPAVDPHWMWLYDISYARWAVNAYYVLEVQNYDFYDVERGYEAYGYHSDDIPRCLGYMTLIALGWYTVAYMIMIMSNRSKKK
eukprot:ANDGO_00205.mRNA.1 ABC transporter G family member 24